MIPAGKPTVLLVRHGESEWNVVRRKGEAARFSEEAMLPDSCLTALGIQQATQAGKVLLDYDVDMIISSPLRRALHTAELAMAGHPCWATADKRVMAELTEQMTDLCDVGSPPCQLKALFPSWSFDQLPEHWWHGGRSVAETLDALQTLEGQKEEPFDTFAERVHWVRQWLQDCSKKVVVVFGHSDFFHCLTGREIQGELMGYWMENGEVYEYDLAQHTSHTAATSEQGR